MAATEIVAKAIVTAMKPLHRSEMEIGIEKGPTLGVRSAPKMDPP